MARHGDLSVPFRFAVASLLTAGIAKGLEMKMTHSV